MQVNISINCGNASFGETEEERAEQVAVILTGLARTIRTGGVDDYPVMDPNGNRVGSVLVS